MPQVAWQDQEFLKETPDAFPTGLLIPMYRKSGETLRQAQGRLCGIPVQAPMYALAFGINTLPFLRVL